MKPRLTKKEKLRGEEGGEQKWEQPEKRHYVSSASGAEAQRNRRPPSPPQPTPQARAGDRGARPTARCRGGRSRRRGRRKVCLAGTVATGYSGCATLLRQTHTSIPPYEPLRFLPPPSAAPGPATLTLTSAAYAAAASQAKLVPARRSVWISLTPKKLASHWSERLRGRRGSKRWLVRKKTKSKGRAYWREVWWACCLQRSLLSPMHPFQRSGAVCAGALRRAVVSRPRG